MGLASFFFRLKVINLEYSNNIKELFRLKCNVSKYSRPSGCLFKKRIIDDNRFVIDNKAVVSVNLLERSTVEITFELCFSNYICNLAYIFDISKWISSLGKTTKLIIYNGYDGAYEEYDFGFLDFERFKHIITKAYYSKYDIFVRRYGELENDILPQDFYSFPKWRRKKVKK